MLNVVYSATVSFAEHTADPLRMFAFFTVLLVTGSVLEVVYGVANYCSIRTCNDKMKQTMCLYPKSGPASGTSCKGYTDAPLTAAERRELLDKHNSYRQKVANGGEKRGAPGPQPSASNMHKLEWDDELAAVAQRWADQCMFAHDVCRDVGRFPVGQNIASIWTTGSSDQPITDMVDLWYEEVELFNGKTVSRFQFDNNIGHYTQMLWAETKLLGCGRIRIQDSRMHRTHLICNYGPAGNMIGSPIYKIGKPASACPEGVSNIVELCA